MKVYVIFHSIYGHIYKMSQAIAEGVDEVEGVEAIVKRVPETLSDEILAKMGATESQAMMADVPVAKVSDLEDADGVIFGTPTRYGSATAQMRAFMDATGGLWAKNTLVGKVGSVFTSSATQHGGQESTILGFHVTLLHHGMIIAGLPYSWEGQKAMDEITGGSPYGISTIAGGQGERMPSENELAGARFQGKYVAELVKKVSA